MSPREFKAAWENRNRRLEEGGVFEHISALWEKYGQQEIDNMTPTQLIEAVKQLSE